MMGSLEQGHVEALIRRLGGTQEARGIVQLLSSGVVERVEAIISRAQQFISGARFDVVLTRAEDPWIEPVVVLILSEAAPTELVAAKLRFDREWWLKQDRDMLEQIGVYLA